MISVLCIDDDAQCLRARKLILELEGYSVLIANTGPRGLKLLSQSPVHAVVLDYKMPYMDGLNVAKCIRSKDDKLPIVLLSGYSKEIPKPLLQMVDAFIPKGQKPDVLLKELRRLTRANKKPPTRERRTQAHRKIA